MESTEQCEECRYKNADMAELIVHIVKEHNNCEFCDPNVAGTVQLGQGLRQIKQY